MPERAVPAGGGLFESIFTNDATLASTSDAAYLGALVEFERALARVEERLGLIPTGAADAVERACDELEVDPSELGVEARAAGNPVVPLVRRLAALAGDAGAYVHFGATSQDALDSATMLVARRALAEIVAELDRATAAGARLADRHRSTPVSGRTLLQPAVPTTFGLKAAGWLVALDEARDGLARISAGRLAVQLGGAAGTLAALEPRGPDAVALLASELGLAEPVLPWHTARGRIAELGTSLAAVTGTAAKVALDVSLLMQAEVAEAAEPSRGAGGGSSAMPHKSNPVAGAVVGAAARRAAPLAATLLAALPQEHERAVGGWHAEWVTLRDLLRLAGGAAGEVARLLEGLAVDASRMRANLDYREAALFSESAARALAPRLGRDEAHALVARAAARAAARGTALAVELAAEPGAPDELRGTVLDGLTDLGPHLDSAARLVERALAAHRARQPDGALAGVPR